jgi:uncharacterized protein YbdZ (MbtH family)
MSKKTSIESLLGTNGERQIEPVASHDPLNPFDVDNLRIDPDYVEFNKAKKVLTTVPVRKPGKQEFVRVNPDPTYRLTVALLELEDDRETYLLSPAFVQTLDEQPHHYATLFTCVNRSRTVSLWPVKLPNPDGKINRWRSSAREAAEKAMRSWIRVVSNQNLGAYEIYEAANQKAEPVWPELTFSQLLGIAFRDRIIEDANHPVMEQLRGA